MDNRLDKKHYSGEVEAVGCAGWLPAFVFGQFQLFAPIQWASSAVWHHIIYKSLASAQAKAVIVWWSDTAAIISIAVISITTGRGRVEQHRSSNVGLIFQSSFPFGGIVPLSLFTPSKNTYITCFALTFHACSSSPLYLVNSASFT